MANPFGKQNSQTLLAKNGQMTKDITMRIYCFQQENMKCDLDLALRTGKNILLILSLTYYYYLKFSKLSKKPKIRFLYVITINYRT